MNADPRRPYKAYVAMAVAFIGSLIATLQGRTDLDEMKLLDWVIVVATTAVAFAGTYSTRNPADTHRA